MSISGYLMRISSDQILLSKGQQQHNLHGQVSVKNTSNMLIAVKVKSNNPSQYIVTPSQVILNPEQKESFTFTKNGYSQTHISDKTDKFQFWAIAIDQSLVQVRNNQKKVDDILFQQIDRINQKAVLEVQYGSEYTSSVRNGSRLNTQQSENGGRSKNYSQTQVAFQRTSPPLRQSTQSNLSGQGGWQNSNSSEMKYGVKSMNPQSTSSIKNPMSPQFPKGQFTDKDKEFKLKYERVIQQVHEYEKNFQQLDQEIKMTKTEKEKWNQIQNASKNKTKVSTGYEAWHVILVMLVSMFIGVLWAK